MQTVFGLSMGIFSLSILEVVPSTWLILLDHDTIGMLHSGYFTVTGAYGILLWALCVWTVLILPGIVGGQLHTRIEKFTRHRASFLTLSIPQWMLLTAKFVFLIWGIFYKLILLPLYRLLRRQIRQLRQNKSEPILVLAQKTSSSTHDRSSPRTSSTSTGTDILSSSYMIGAIMGIVANFLFLQTLGSLVISQQGEYYNILSTLVSWLCAVGLVLSSILNGFGSVSLPHSCLAGFYIEPIQPAVIAQAENELLSATNALELMMAELTDVLPIASATNNNRRKQASRKSFADYGKSDEGTKRKLDIQHDIDFLEMLVVELQEDIAEMKHAQYMAGEARTPAGRIKLVMGMVFSIILLVRLFTSILSVVHMDDTTSTSAVDPITAAFLWLNGHHYVKQQDYIVLSQGISLLLTIFLSFSQFRTFLRTIEAVNRRLLLVYRKFHCTQKQNTPLTVLEHVTPPGTFTIYAPILATLTGCYCLSCVVLTKMNLPLEYRAGFSAALGGMNFTIQSSILNLVFSVSAAVSATVLGLLFGIQRQNVKRHAATHKETLSSLDVLDTC